MTLENHAIVKPYHHGYGALYSNDFIKKILAIHASLEQDSNNKASLRFLAFIAVMIAHRLRDILDMLESVYKLMMENLEKIIDAIARVMDGLYYSLSMLKFFCEADTESFTKILNDSKYNHLTTNWRQHKLILIAFLVAIPIFILISLLGSQEFKISKGIQQYCLSLREIVSRLKNTHVAVVSTAFIAQAFAHSTRFYAWANPIGIVAGLMCMANVIWLQRMEEKRESLITENEKNIAALADISTLKELESKRTCFHPFRHSYLQQSALYAAVFGDGLIDGIYIYACLFTVIGFSIAVFTPASLIAATVIVMVITLLSIASKLIAEHKKACVLELSAVNLDIAYLNKIKILHPEKLSTDEINELIALENKKDTLMITIGSDDKLSKFSIGRQGLMGFKNADTIGALLLLIPGISIPAKIAFWLGKSLGAIYACYLANDEAKKQNISIKSASRDKTLENSITGTVHTFFKKTPSAVQCDKTFDYIDPFTKAVSFSDYSLAC